MNSQPTSLTVDEIEIKVRGLQIVECLVKYRLNIVRSMEGVPKLIATLSNGMKPTTVILNNGTNLASEPNFFAWDPTCFYGFTNFSFIPIRQYRRVGKIALFKISIITPVCPCAVYMPISLPGAHNISAPPLEFNLETKNKLPTARSAAETAAPTTPVLAFHVPSAILGMASPLGSL